MVKANPYQIENIISNIKNYRGALIYGPDYGLGSIRSDKIIKTFFPDKIDNFRYFEFTYDELKENDSKLISAIKSISFGKGRKIIKIKGLGQTVNAAFKSAIEEVSENEFILMIADDLTPSGIRKTIEEHPSFITIPCYKPDANVVKQKILQLFKANNITITDDNQKDVIDYMESVFSNDSMIMENELEKIRLTLSNQSVTINQIAEIIGSGMESRVDEFVFALLDKNIRQADQNYDLIVEEYTPTGVCRIIASTICKLIDIKISIKQNQYSIEEAVKLYKPTIFFKSAPMYIKACSQFSIDELKLLLKKVYSFDLNAKLQWDAEVIFKNNLYNIV